MIWISENIEALTVAAIVFIPIVLLMACVSLSLSLEKIRKSLDEDN